MLVKKTRSKEIKSTNFGTKKCCVKKNVQSKMWGSKKFGFKVFFCSKTFCGQKKLCQKNLEQKILSLRPQSCVQKVCSLLGQQQLRYSGKGQMMPGKLLPGQMSPWHLASVIDCPRNLPLKFGQKRVNNSWYIPDMDNCNQDKCCLD